MSPSSCWSRIFTFATDAVACFGLDSSTFGFNFAYVFLTVFSNSVSTIFWTYLLKMCKKPIEIDGFNSCLGKQGADAKFGTYLAHSTQDTRYNASLFFLSKGARRLGFISFSILFSCVSKSFNTFNTKPFNIG